MRSFFRIPRLQILRTIAPRQPLLPTSRIRLGTSALTHSPRPPSVRLFNNFPARLTSNPPPSPDPRDTLPPDASLSQRLKHLIKSYGWYALGVYAIVGVLDFGVAFLGVNLLGAEYVSHVTSTVKNMVMGFIHSRPAEPGKDEIEPISGSSSGGQEGLYALLVLAYTIHKLLLPVRVGLTAALTPRIVGWLSQRGWAGTTGARRAATHMREKIKERKNRSNHD